MNDSQLDDQFRRMFQSWSHFCYPANDEDGHANLVRQCVINSRPNTHYGKQFPGIGDMAGVAYAAMALNEPVAIRAIQLYLQNNRLFENDYKFSVLNASGPNAHISSYAQNYVGLVDIWADLEAMAPTSYRFPMEENEPDFAWADEQAQAVVLKHSSVKMFMSLNWRKPTTDRSHDGTSPSNVARVHYLTDSMARVANVPMETPYGLYELYFCEYGDYAVLMNESESGTSYSVAVPSGYPDIATELISGQSHDLTSGPIEIAPETTLVLYIGAPEYCGDSNTVYLEADFNKDCYVDILDLAELADGWLDLYDMLDFAVMGSDWSPDGYDY
jgi:hypothetical protein